MVLLIKSEVTVNSSGSDGMATECVILVSTT